MPIPGPVGPDAIPNCVPMNVFGQGNVSQAAHDYAVSQKEGVGTVTQEFAEVLFTGDIWEGFGPGPFSMAGGLPIASSRSSNTGCRAKSNSTARL